MLPWAIKDDVKQEFEEQLLAHMNSLYNLGFRLTGRREDASDLVQEASMKAYRFYHKFQQGTNFKAWVLTILRNTFINQYRKKRREPLVINSDDYENVEHFISMPETVGFEEEIFGEQVQQSIDKLPEELRTTVVLFYVEGLSYQEIARVMGCPIGTVMSRLHMARQSLKKKLTTLVKRAG